MAVAFMRGTTTGPNDLNITVRNALSQLIDPFRLEYTVYDYTTNVEVLMGSPVNIPVKMSTGQYYAQVMIPADSNVGDWRLRWTIQETAADPVYQSVQEFNVVGSNVITSVTGDPNLDKLLHTLRIILRDNNPDRNYSVDGGEKVTIRIGTKILSATMKKLWKLYKDGGLKEGFEVRSVTKDCKIEWRKVTDVTRHDVSRKSQYKVSLDNYKSCRATGDHSLFSLDKGMLKDIKTADFISGSDLVFVTDNNVGTQKILSNRKLILPTKYMYDLSVESNENFILDSGILAHNSFRPPSKERFIQGQTQVFGFIWEDEELLEYLYLAVDDLNSRPPVTGIIINDLWGGAQKWRTAVIMRAAAFACFAIAMNWIADEFSIGKDEKLTVKVGDVNEEETLPIEELFTIIYGEKMIAYQDLARQGIDEVRHGKFIAFCKKFMRQIKLWPNSPKNILRKRLQGAFERGQLYIKSYVQETKAVAWKPIKDVLKHNAEHKKIMNVLTTKRNGDIVSLIVTEDHSLFNWNTMEPIKTSDIERNFKLIGLNNDNFDAYDVRTIQPVPYQDPVYDLSVPGTENFFTTSGLLAHNTYSISGVSLDIEKSSKYQSMKDEYIAEYDKLVEAAKRSVKIVKGLRMQKFGTGIMSALGPLSRPGVQSRRSMIESSRPVWI